jgi:putative SOS response-associated peptidase YedK
MLGWSVADWVKGRSVAGFRQVSPGVPARAGGASCGPGPRFNIAPIQPVPIVRAKAGHELGIVRVREGVRELVLARWGLIPSWTKDVPNGHRLISARAETVAEKSTFRARHCIISASGFYEWRRRGPSRRVPRPQPCRAGRSGL